MKTIYLDCASGISGDMTLGALIDAGADLATIQRGIDSLGLPSCRLSVEEVKKCGFRALQLQVHHEPEHAHRHLHHITDMIDSSELNARQRDFAKRIFTKLGEAEAKVHGTDLRKVHFHEVGAVDSIADIVGCAIGFDLLGMQRLVCSPVPTGHGFVEIAHGRCSIPAPATTELLRGVPIAESTVEAELTTPTGAAIVATLAEKFGPAPAMNIQAIGYGSGQRDLKEQANLLRLLVGESTEESPATTDGVVTEQLVLLETNLDDTTGEAVGHAKELLLQAGALDVYTTAIGMKKNRPGVMLSVLCEPAEAMALESILWRETTTLGIRHSRLARRSLPRTSHKVETPYGTVEGKLASLPEGRRRFSPEFEACREAATVHGVSLSEVYDAARQAFDADA